LKQHFAQTISHELRTPLNLIVGFSETMIQSPEYYGSALPPLYMRDLTIVHRNACHLQALVNDVLDLARIESAHMGLQMAEVDLAELAEEAVNTARALVEARGLAFNVHIAPDLPRTWVDPVRIKQIIFNLLNNAARFTDHGSVTLDVALRGDEVIFAVIDTGLGIPPEHLEHIFEPFRQLDDPMRRRAGGAGLGLTISQQLARLHGGQVRVESRVGEGSAFSLHLPLQGKTPESPPGGAPETPTYSPSPQRTRDNVALLVSNSPSASAMLSRALRMCRTISVTDLDQAQQAARHMLPQAIILDTSDQRLAQVDPGALAEAWGVPSTPLIACPLPGEEVIRRRLAAHGFLIKPISHEVLWDTLRPFGESVTDILIVDDDPDFVRLMERMLDNPLKRYRVASAHSGREALGLIEWRTPDLVLLDLDMPDIDGFELCRRIRANPDWGALRVVIVSGQEEWDVSNTLHGQFAVSRAAGLASSEVLKWLQSVLGNLMSAPASLSVVP
jgi:CheY-like chemotaxis protein/anti-sigma regulatory factor (Ser/Thr protein kinase)